MDGWRVLDGALIFAAGAMAGVVLVVIAARARPAPPAPPET